MTKPRYTVGSVSGYTIGPSWGYGFYGTAWYVYDRLYGYRPVAVFPGGKVRSEKQPRGDIEAAKQARMLARELNREQAAA